MQAISRSHSKMNREPGEQWSPALASMATPLWVSSLSAAVVVALVLLSTQGFGAGFASSWVENWLVVWALAFPVFYMSGPALARALDFASSPASDTTAVTDIASTVAHSSGREGFTVLRNLKVREGFYPA